MLAAGFLCRHGYLSLYMVIFTAFSGTVIFEQIVYFIGRLYGKALLKKFPKFKDKAYRAMAFLRKYNTVFIFMYRFIYGIRNISPLMIGIARVPKLKYAILNVLASIVWASSIASLGYFCAGFLEQTSSSVQLFQKLLFVVLSAFLVSIVIAYSLKNNKRSK